MAYRGTPAKGESMNFHIPTIRRRTSKKKPKEPDAMTPRKTLRKTGHIMDPDQMREAIGALLRI